MSIIAQAFSLKLFSCKTCNLNWKPSSGQGSRSGRRFRQGGEHQKGPLPLATRLELSDFLADVERRAFKQAVFATRSEEDALDLVQDAMMRLSEKYGDRPATELPLLFQRILQNAIRDFYRRHRVRTLWVTLLSAFSGTDDDDSADPLETLERAGESNSSANPESELVQSRVMATIEAEIEKLPARQREAFLMRYWEDMDVAETAAAMGCSEGSVKTHCSRATHTLAAALQAKGITL